LPARIAANIAKRDFKDVRTPKEIPVDQTLSKTINTPSRSNSFQDDQLTKSIKHNPRRSTHQDDQTHSKRIQLTVDQNTFQDDKLTSRSNTP
ncbi:hypothetical protein AVEN_70820-1, partial [Araneus ventricosus]